MVAEKEEKNIEAYTITGMIKLKGFIKTCEELEVNIVPTPTVHSQKEKDIKSWMRKRKS